MHISEGVLSPFVIGAGWAVAVPTSVVYKQTRFVAYGVVATAFFAGSTIHVPVGSFSMHLVLSGIAGLLSFLSSFSASLRYCVRVYMPTDFSCPQRTENYVNIFSTAVARKLNK